MDTAEIEHWFAAYLADFAALGRGDLDDVGRILAHYGVPLIISSDAGCMFLTDEAQVRATAQQQVDALRAAGYDRSEVLAAATTVLNHFRPRPDVGRRAGRATSLRAEQTPQPREEPQRLSVPLRDRHPAPGRD